MITFVQVLNALYSKKRASVVGTDAGPEGAVSNLLDMVNKDFKMEEIFAKCKELSKVRKFDESFEVIVKLNVDPTQGDQNVRGTCVLPAGTG